MSNRSTWDGIPEGLHGDETTTGAQGLSSLPNFSNAHLGALRHGDKTTPCPKCGKVGEIIGNIPTMNLEGKIAAGADAVVICGCPMGTNRLISPAGQWMGNAPRPEPTDQIISRARTTRPNSQKETHWCRCWFLRCSPAIHHGIFRKHPVCRKPAGRNTRALSIS